MKALFTNYRRRPETLKQVVELIVQNLPQEEELEIDVRRNFVVQDALREGRKKKFSTRKKLKV